MKKKKIIILVLLVIVLIPICYFAYVHFTKEEQVKEIYKGKFANKMPRVDASLATQPLMDALVKYFGGSDNLKTVQENYTNTHPGYVKLIQGETDLIIVTEPSSEEIALAKEKGVELVVEKVVNEGFVFFVNANNKVDSLSLEEIRNIYSGKITNWNEVGGNNASIVAYQRPVNSGSQTGMLSLVMKDTPLKEPKKEELIALMGEIIDIVADYDNNPDGIGYSYYYYANTMYSSPNIKFLKINGIKPTYETIQNETYPIMTAYYIVTRKDATEDVLNFKKAIKSEEGKLIAKAAGYVPIK